MGRSTYGGNDSDLVEGSMPQVPAQDKKESRSVKRMNREEAIDYLQRKKKPTTEAEVKKVMSEGKIYGDPLVEMDV